MITKNESGQASASPSSNENKSLQVAVAPKGANPNQGILNLGIERQIEIDGVGMGVLSDGTPFLEIQRQM